MAKKANNKKETSKEVKPLTTTKTADGWNRVTVSNGVEFWSPKEKGDSVEGVYVETLEYKNTGTYAKNKPMQLKPILKRSDGSQVAIPDNWRIHQAVKQFGNVLYRITFDGQQKGTGEHKGKKFNNFIIDHMDVPKGYFEETKK